MRARTRRRYDVPEVLRRAWRLALYRGEQPKTRAEILARNTALCESLQSMTGATLGEVLAAKRTVEENMEAAKRAVGKGTK